MKGANKMKTITEIQKLSIMLSVTCIPFDFHPLYDGWQICYPNGENRVCDAICHSGSYGHENGLLEIMGLVDGEADDEVEGYLTADEVFNRIVKHYFSN